MDKGNGPVLKPAEEPDMTVRRAARLLMQQIWKQIRRRWVQILGSLIAVLMVGFVLFAMLNRAGVFLRDVSLTVTATVYNADGEPSGETTVSIDGERTILGSRSFSLNRAGVFLRDVSLTVTATVYNADGEPSGETTVSIDGERTILGSRSFSGRFSIDTFGLKLEDGTIIATDEAYVPLLLSGYHYAIRPVFSNQH